MIYEYSQKKLDKMVFSEYRIEGILNKYMRKIEYFLVNH